jgi:hypothetical protein
MLTLKGYPGILDGRLCCLADLEKSEAQARVLHAPNECWLFNTTSYQSRAWSAGLLDKCARFHQCLCSQSDQRDKEEHKSTAFLCGGLIQWKNWRVTCNSASPGNWSPCFFFQKKWLLIAARLCNYTHTHTQPTANSTTATMAKFIGDTVTWNKSWPPESPYLTIPDSYFLRYLKQNVYSHKPHNLQGRQYTPERCTATIYVNIMENVLRNWR